MSARNFLEPETRDGYFISAEMKAAWKVMMDIVEEIVRICDKYNLKYSLAGGTLLGAIRHKGFIPWDDDIDIDMEREDYDKFLSVAGKEIKYPLFLQTALTDPGRPSAFAKVCNSETTGIDLNWVKHKWRFNMGIGVDIFPIDGMPKSGSRKYRCLWRKLRIVEAILGRRFDYSAKTLLQKCKRAVCWLAYAIIGGKRLFDIRERAFAANKIKDCEMCGEISFRFNRPDAMWPSKCYDSYLTVPFEYLNLKILGGYDAYLTAMYGDWRTPRQGGGFHGEIVLDAKTPYKRMLVEKFDYKKRWLEHLPGAF